MYGQNDVVRHSHAAEPLGLLLVGVVARRRHSGGFDTLVLFALFVLAIRATHATAGEANGKRKENLQVGSV